MLYRQKLTILNAYFPSKPLQFYTLLDQIAFEHTFKLFTLSGYLLGFESERVNAI